MCRLQRLQIVGKKPERAHVQSQKKQSALEISTWEKKKHSPALRRGGGGIMNQHRWKQGMSPTPSSPASPGEGCLDQPVSSVNQGLDMGLDAASRFPRPPRIDNCLEGIRLITRWNSWWWFSPVNGYRAKLAKGKLCGVDPGGNQVQASRGLSLWSRTGCTEVLKQRAVTTCVKCGRQGILTEYSSAQTL